MPLHPKVVKPELGVASSSDVTTIGEAQVSNAMTHNQSPPSIEMAERKDEAIMISPKEIKLPEQRGTEMTREFQYKHASTYRKIFAFIFIANASVFIALMVTSRAMPLSRDAASAASANLMVFHYGGFHSGAGVAATAWYLTYTVLATQEWAEDRKEYRLVNMITGWVVVTMFFIILIAAYPSIRRKFHDHFEAFHRFAGWISLLSFWVHNIVSARVSAHEWDKSISYALVRSPNFWCLCVTTSCTVASWSRLRRRVVYPEKLSDHATRLHFKYRGMKPFYGLKISDKPLTEWHAFATIPDIEPESGKVNGFSVVVSNAGDFTKKQILNADERKLWVRGAPLHGLLYTTRLFQRIVVVATGSGIGPCLSLLYADVTPRRVLWSTRDPEKTYGPTVVSAVQRADPNAVIWNTTTRGYPDIVLETYKLVVESDAEAVYIISNPKVTEKVVFGMRSRGVVAYGAIFDS
ncbi:hypothetical protein KAF25_002338 [Fusarium avenaceum]|uniref:Non-ribosomal peptide synthetase n=1 Tax=Fusarium avenaceum TaxID=40199 RepID=A0A9P7H103_9HYPO|nr:hypothetical protein KAF25_002338 [Fusarium avenaceum]